MYEYEDLHILLHSKYTVAYIIISWYQNIDSI